MTPGTRGGSWNVNKFKYRAAKTLKYTDSSANKKNKRVRNYTRLLSGFQKQPESTKKATPRV